MFWIFGHYLGPVEPLAFLKPNHAAAGEGVEPIFRKLRCIYFFQAVNTIIIIYELNYTRELKIIIYLWLEHSQALYRNYANN